MRLKADYILQEFNKYKNIVKENSLKYNQFWFIAFLSEINFACL